MADNAKIKSMGTFGGVFTPSVLTILGIILFLRLGYVTGSAGLARALMIIGAANAISILTTVSLAAIATNLRVKGGGDYYLISRTLGVEFGGSIGLVLFLAQSVSVGFYCLGFGEAAADILGWRDPFSVQILAAGAMSVLFVFAWLGADWATRFQYVVMTAMILALASFFWGGLPEFSLDRLSGNWSALEGGPGFWMLFAIFFPAVTGFTQGVSMSGELKDPGRSLPLGTFAAVGISILVYFGVALVLSGARTNLELSRDLFAMKSISRFGVLIDAGVIAATLSSAMASFLGAPRILQSLAGDHVFTWLNPFAKGSGPADNPRRAVLLSAGLGLFTIAMGELNLIAPVVSMFFLISYGLLNYATYFEAKAKSPSFRPRFKWFDYRLSLLGALCCLGAMLAINPAAGAVAISVIAATYQYLKRYSGPAGWADSRRSHHLQLIREHALAAAREPEHARDWRPQILAFSEDRKRRTRLLRFASWLEAEAGLTTLISLKESHRPVTSHGLAEIREVMERDIRDAGSNAFALPIEADDIAEAALVALQAYGLGPIRANLLLLNRPRPGGGEQTAHTNRFLGRGMADAFRLGMNLVMLNAEPGSWRRLGDMEPEERRMDIWWTGDASSRLSLLLAHMLTRNRFWQDAPIRVLAASPGGDGQTVREELAQVLEEARIQASPAAVYSSSHQAFTRMSGDAALVFAPFSLKGGKPVCRVGGELLELLDRLPLTATIMASENLDLDPEPEEGKAAELARAFELLESARKNAAQAEDRAARAARDAGLETADIKSLTETDDPNLKAKVKKALRARDKAGRAARRAARALVRLESATREYENMGGHTGREGKPGADDED